MRINALLILLPLLLALGGSKNSGHPPPSLPTSSMQNINHTLIAADGKYVFIRGNKFKFSYSGVNILRNEKYEAGGQIRYEVDGVGVMIGEHPNVSIKFSDKELTINSSPMRENINAVIEEDGKVYMGSFIRTFD